MFGYLLHAHIRVRTHDTLRFFDAEIRHKLVERTFDAEIRHKLVERTIVLRFDKLREISPVDRYNLHHIRKPEIALQIWLLGLHPFL